MARERDYKTVAHKPMCESRLTVIAGFTKKWLFADSCNFHSVFLCFTIKVNRHNNLALVKRVDRHQPLSVISSYCWTVSDTVTTCQILLYQCQHHQLKASVYPVQSHCHWLFTPGGLCRQVSSIFLRSVCRCECACMRLCSRLPWIYEQTAQTLTSNQLLMRDPVSKFMPRANEWVCSQTQPDTESVETPLGCWQTVLRGLRLMKSPVSRFPKAGTAHPLGLGALWVVRGLIWATV